MYKNVNMLKILVVVWAVLQVLWPASWIDAQQDATTKGKKLSPGL
jgi:hypothetical protein